MSTKKRRLSSSSCPDTQVKIGDIVFKTDLQLADYHSSWSSKFNDRTLINVTACTESVIIFASREGWISSTAPTCQRAECRGKNNTCHQRSKNNQRRYWYWRFRCCGRLQSLLSKTIFWNTSYGAGVVLEIMWKMSSRTPVSMIPKLIFGCEKSEIFKWIFFFRDVAGWFEDSNTIQMGGPGKTIEADGTFVIGKRKNGMGRMVSKEHVYVITERGSRKIRRLCVKDKSAQVLSIFNKHILPNSTICVDPGTENNHFKNLDLITALHQIPGPIHFNRENPFENTQTVESSHSGIKMRLRLGRGLRRHHLQS